MKRRNDVYVIILRWFLLLISQHGTVPVMGEIDDMNGNCQGGEGCESQCGVYLAISSLPGVGIGMFAGRDFTERERLMKVGDQMIPIVDRSVPCLWDSYVWVGSLILRSIFFGVWRVSQDQYACMDSTSYAFFRLVIYRMD